MILFIDKYGHYLAALVVLLIGVFVSGNFPVDAAYHRGADEGNYYQQAKLLTASGTTGFQQIATIFIQTPGLHDTPHPLRLGSMVVSALFIHFHDAFSMLSLLSLSSFLLLLISTYLFIATYWGKTRAFFTLLLLAASPIELGMARCALMDSLALMSCALSLFTFIRMLDTGRLLFVILFTLFFVFAIEVKETAVLLFPFYGMVLMYLKLTRQTPMTWTAIGVSLICPVLFSGLIYLSVYGWEQTIAIVNIIKEPSPYSSLYGQGPWYRYLMDYMMVSPYILLLSIGFLGAFFASDTKDLRVLLLVLLAVYLLFTYGLLSKNLRYCLLLDIPIRFFAASMLLLMLNKAANYRYLFLIGIIFLICFDLWQFHFYFIENQLYDTISYNFLAINHIIPR